MLLLSGESDPFARIELLRASVGSLASAELVTYPGVGHGFPRHAKAFDDGTIIPDSILLDVPADYSGYVPENYDGTYRGQVMARDALIQSLNATAVKLLSMNHTVVVLVGRIHKGVIKALAYAKSLQPEHLLGMATLLAPPDVTTRFAYGVRPILMRQFRRVREAGAYPGRASGG